MANFANFPMNRLCYDLVLEVIDELDPKVVPELIKVDRRFRWILLQKPARNFGKQVHSIHVKQREYWMTVKDDDEEESENENNNNDCFYITEIRKFPESTSQYFNLDSDVLLLAQVERCSVLNISQVGDHDIDKKELSALKKIFANLKQVDELKIYGDNFSDCLVNFKAEVTDRASLKVYRRNDGVDQELLLSLIGGRLQHCRTISLAVTDLYPTVHSALSKTQLELFVAEIFPQNIVSSIELILNSGIPSENKEAACLVRGQMEVEINNLIKNFPEIHQVNEPNKTLIRDTMMETLRKHRFMDGGCYRSNFAHSRSDSDHSRRSIDPRLINGGVERHAFPDGPFDCYLKRIDEKRDCIYVVNDNFFFAKYVSSIQF